MFVWLRWVQHKCINMCKGVQGFMYIISILYKATTCVCYILPLMPHVMFICSCSFIETFDFFNSISEINKYCYNLSFLLVTIVRKATKFVLPDLFQLYCSTCKSIHCICYKGHHWLLDALSNGFQVTFKRFPLTARNMQIYALI